MKITKYDLEFTMHAKTNGAVCGEVLPAKQYTGTWLTQKNAIRVLPATK